MWGSGLGRLSIPISDLWTAVPLFPWAHLEMHASSTFIRRRQWHPTPVLLPGNSHGWRSLVGCSPWGRKESDTTERLHFHSSLACIGEGHGNPLQCSCLENPRAGGAWWAAVCGVAQSRTRLKRLSSSTFTGSRRCWEPHFAGCPPHPDLFPGPSVVLAAPPLPV